MRIALMSATSMSLDETRDYEGHVLIIQLGPFMLELTLTRRV